MTFIIATICSYWYYNLEGSPITKAYIWIFTKQIGSLAFASLVISIVTFARMIIQNKRRNNNNIAVAICLCLVNCLLRAV